MKSLVQIKALLGAMALAALVPMTLDAQRPTFIGNPNLVRGDAPELNDCTDADVARIARDAEAGVDWQEQAIGAGMTVRNNLLLLEVSSDDESRSTLREILNEFEARILSDGATSRVRVLVNPQFVHELESMLRDSVGHPRIHAYRSPVANAYGYAVTEGEEVMRSGLYGLDGEGAIVAVMDIGFSGLYEAESGQVKLRSPGFGVDGEAHGTAMVEVIRDVAPEAEILAYTINENMNIQDATLDAITCGADVIVSALSYFDIPGRSLADDAASIATANGVKWINAAGNFGDGRYFEAQSPELVDLSGEQFVAFGPDDPYQYIQNTGEIRVHFAQESDAADPIDAQLALELYSWDGMSADLMLEADGNPNHRVQTIVHAADPDKYYFPMLRLVQQGSLQRIRMFSETAPLFFSSEAGSIACPGGTGGVITVGAVNVENYAPGSVVENYSGRAGGVFDLNLNLCGPSHCTTSIYGSQGFTGTSAAAAHVAGLVALHLTDAGLAQDPVGLIRTADIMALGNDIDSGAGLAMAQMDDAEPDNDMTRATDLIAVGLSAGGRSLSPSGDQDWFSFELSEAMSAEIVCDAARVILFIETESGFIEKIEGLSHTVLESGNYFIQVTGGFAASYDIQLELYQDAPESVTNMRPADGAEILVPAGTARLELEWEAPEGLGPISYQVQVMDGEDSRISILDDITSDTSISVFGLQTNKPYIWRVRAMNPYGDAAFSEDHSFILVEAEVANEELLAPHAVENASANEASGCVGSTGSNGMIALLIALVAAAALKQRKLVRTKA